MQQRHVEVDDHGHPKKDAIISIIDDIASGIHKSWGDASANYKSSTLIDEVKKSDASIDEPPKSNTLVTAPALAPAK